MISTGRSQKGLSDIVYTTGQPKKFDHRALGVPMTI